ncbi:MAG: hypothetical protein EBV06_07740 [Planctomycetia bacterium]|nr:hypothetical protein [Planctomycetia bacterium]
MKRILFLAALVLTTTAQAQVVVRAPGVHVEVGPAVVVRAFGVEVIVPRRGPKPPVAPPPMIPSVKEDSDVPPVPREENDLLPVPLPNSTRRRESSVSDVNRRFALSSPVTPGEFVAGHKPFKPGAYEVVFVHPATNKPVKVNFDLPISPRRVNVSKTQIDFRWGLLKGLTLLFEADGSVRLVD